LHLIVDGYGGDPRTLRDSDLVYGFLDACPDEIHMTKIAPPQVYTYRGKRPEDWGLSGFVLIAESHISVHTFPDRGHVNVDIFSCKSFDVEDALAVVKETFGVPRTNVWTLERGLEYLSTREAYRGMVRERVELLPSTGKRDA
jgi:S-adenosylmethionine decarboxylase